MAFGLGNLAGQVEEGQLQGSAQMGPHRGPHRCPPVLGDKLLGDGLPVGGDGPLRQGRHPRSQHIHRQQRSVLAAAAPNLAGQQLVARGHISRGVGHLGSGGRRHGGDAAHRPPLADGQPRHQEQCRRSRPRGCRSELLRTLSRRSGSVPSFPPTVR
eukprot:scaffold14015_cov112-Isochrysis_galbana.AAC.3